jgi:CO/xanthine dehydrogenase Mo-binding subunit
VPAAIANAVNAALGGLSHALPLTSERALARITEAEDAA